MFWFTKPSFQVVGVAAQGIIDYCHAHGLPRQALCTAAGIPRRLAGGTDRRLPYVVTAAPLSSHYIEFILGCASVLVGG